MARSSGGASAGGTVEVHTDGGTDSRGNGLTVTRLQESRVDQLIDRIRPAEQSELRRNFVAQHVRTLIAQCFQPKHEVRQPASSWSAYFRLNVKLNLDFLPFMAQVHAFIFGSVPLKTYLPDGDIDLSLFLKSGPPIRDSWAQTLASYLEQEQARPGSCRVKDVQVVNAEVSNARFRQKPASFCKKLTPLLCQLHHLALHIRCSSAGTHLLCHWCR